MNKEEKKLVIKKKKKSVDFLKLSLQILGHIYTR